MNYGLLQELTYALKALEREERIARLWNNYMKKELKKMKELALN